MTNSDFPTDQTFHQFRDLYTELDLHRIMSGFHGSFATGVASQQGTLTLPDTWFRPPFWDLLMLQLLRPNFSNLPCLYSTFHLEYPLVLSRFCSSSGNMSWTKGCGCSSWLFSEHRSTSGPFTNGETIPLPRSVEGNTNQQVGYFSNGGELELHFNQDHCLPRAAPLNLSSSILAKVGLSSFGRTRHFIRNRATVTLWRPQIKQYTAS